MEQWKQIQGYPKYMVSDYGRVKSFVHKDEKILTPRIGKKHLKSVRHLPYLYVALYNNGKPKGFLLHRLVAIHFIPNTYNLPQVNHIDNNVSNNKIDNLEWVTPSQNVLHSIINFGRKERRGVDNNKSKFKELEILEIRRIYPIVKSQRRIAKMFGVTQSAIKQIVNIKSWNHI